MGMNAKQAAKYNAQIERRIRGIEQKVVKNNGGGKKNGSQVPVRKQTFAPVSKGNQRRLPRPVMRGIGRDGTIEVTHREYLMDITAQTVDFVTETFNINAGNSNTFPWLATLAGRYEKYHFKSLAFEFDTMSTTQQTGFLGISMDPDVADAAPTTKLDMMSYHNAVRSQPWDSCRYVLTQEDLSSPTVKRYVRLGNTYPTNTDRHVYDVGNVFVGRGLNQASSTPLGEIYVVYKVLLYTPTLNPTDEITAASGKAACATGVTRAAPFGTAPAYTGGVWGQNTAGQPLLYGITLSTTTGTITFRKPCQCIMALHVIGTVTTAVNPTLTPSGGCTATLLASTNGPGAAVTDVIYLYQIVTVGQSETLLLDFTACAATITGTVIRIAQYNLS